MTISRGGLVVVDDNIDDIYAPVRVRPRFLWACVCVSLYDPCVHVCL